MKSSIIIPNFNGAKLLEKNLLKILDSGANEVVVVDDASSDNSLKVIKRFKEIVLIQNRQNLGFVNSVNKGVQEASGEIIVLLNNDVEPEKNFLKPVLPYFKNQKIFAVTFSEPQFSWAKASYTNGFIVHNPGKRQDKPHVSFWASGGSAAYSAEKWQTLDGMDPIYRPFYWEDIDLSFRAWKRGWEVWWEPKSIVHHKHGETIEKYFSKNYREYVSARNQLFFIWKNIINKKLIDQHKSNLLKKLASGQLLRPFFGALLKLSEILEKRKKEKKEAKLNDEEIFEKFA